MVKIKEYTHNEKLYEAAGELYKIQKKKEDEYLNPRNRRRLNKELEKDELAFMKQLKSQPTNQDMSELEAVLKAYIKEKVRASS